MPRGRTLAKLAVGILILLVTYVAGWLSGRAGIGSIVEPASLSEAERAFVERMSGSSLVGQFTIAGREDRAGRPERYDISSVEKVGDDQWRFNARVRYGDIDTTAPIVVPMRFVGDTPMISMTDLAIPGMGTFTVRVFFYDDRYAGSWQHGEFGGHMFGRIEKTTTN
jgi:hypothetical protein